MHNNLSIESIKKTLIDRLMNNVEVLEYLEADEFMKKFDNIQIKDLYNELIYGYGKTEGSNNFISVEVNERNESKYEYKTDNITNQRYYVITIIMRTKHECLDKLASVIKDISLKEYPCVFNFSNVYDYERYNRVISFYIEE